MSKIIYGLETVKPNGSLLNKLDAYQLRQLRKIIGWTPTYIDRTKTNESAINEINRIIKSQNNDTENLFMKLSDKLQLKQNKLFGHILRSNNDDPIRQITFLPDTATPNIPNKKRVGKPRQNWIISTAKYVYENVLFKNQGRIYQNTQDINDQILQAAKDRIF